VARVVAIIWTTRQGRGPGASLRRTSRQVDKPALILPRGSACPSRHVGHYRRDGDMIDGIDPQARSARTNLTWRPVLAKWNAARAGRNGLF